MATSVVTAPTTKVGIGPGVTLLVGTVSIAAGDYVEGGLPMQLVNMTQQGPLSDLTVFIAGITGYVYEYDVNADTLIIREQLAPADLGILNIPLTELAVAAVPAAVVADVIQIMAIGRKDI